MRILLAPLGSEGDVNPFLWLAAGLHERGHEVTLLLSPHYGWLADAKQIPWTAVGTEEDFLKFARHPKIWDPREGTQFVIKATVGLFEVVRESYRRAGGPFDLVVTSTMGMAISSLAEAQGIPRVTLHLQPICLRSVHDMPLYLGGTEWLNRLPHFLKRGFFALVDAMLAKFMRRPLNEFRRSLRLKPIKNVYWGALMASDEIGLLFPTWYAEPQPDWPKNLRQFSFPLPRIEPQSLDEGLELFLAAGEPPILWSHGSANFEVKAFQAVALAASRGLGERCLLVSLETPDQPLPEGSFHVRHAKFEALFPRCRAVVNHGGIGTISKAMAAGVPQLVVPMAHDQPDNGARVEKLGVGESLPYSKFKTATAIERLRRLLESDAMRKRCHEIQARLADAKPLPELCDWIEFLLACRKI